MEVLDHAERRNSTPQLVLDFSRRGFQSRAQTVLTDQVEVDSRLARFYEQFRAWNPEHQSRAPWEMVQNRLLANGAFLLDRAEELQEGGLLFGVDESGRPLVTDGGLEPVLKGMNYWRTRESVCGRGGRPTGFEMFSFGHEYVVSPEIRTFEEFTDQAFVRSDNGSEWRSAWLDSGQNPSPARVVRVRPGSKNAFVDVADPKSSGASLGTRRLLRLRAPRIG